MKAKIEFYKHCSAGAIHYYGKIVILPEYEETIIFHTLTDEDIWGDPIRWKNYKPGNLTEAHSSWRSLLKIAKEMLIEMGISEGDVIVSGVPNNKEMSLKFALSDNVDTRARCYSCQKTIRGGCYNTPVGLYCTECYETK